MALLRLCSFAAVLFATPSLQASKDPLNDFCRRWAHQTAYVDGKLYIDGGLVAWKPLSSNPLNYTNTWLLYSDLNTTNQVGMPMQYANLTKDNRVPNVFGGVLWSDEVNKCFYLYGGEFQNVPQEFSFWAYDTLLNQWNETKYESNVNSLQRVSFGAGTQVEELGRGYYLGGYLNNHTSPDWTGDAIATSDFVTYDFTRGIFTNSSGPDSIGRSEGSLHYLPASDGGLLVYFGGVEASGQNGSLIGANMSKIHIFDISSSKWYTQTAGGTVPPSRRQFCAGATWADDHTSYQIHLYGGFSTDQGNTTAFDDAYILSIPSFTWIKAWPAENTTSVYGHGGCSATVVKRDQMIIIGGWFPNTQDCDTPDGWGQHNMNLGYNGAQQDLWDKYDPKLSAYAVPTPVISVIGGGPTGDATVTKPPSWDHIDLAVYFTRVPSFSARTATRVLPTATASPSRGRKVSVGAIVGSAVGGLVALIAILLLILFCLHRRHRKAKKQKDGKLKAPTPPPVELAATSPVPEMTSPGAAKYMTMQSHDTNTHLPISGSLSVHSRSHSDPISPTWQYAPLAYQSMTPSTPPPFPSPYAAEFAQNPAVYPQAGYPLHSDSSNTTYDPHAYPQPSPPLHQRQYSYPPPSSSPSHPSIPLLPQQENQQVYYPPPPDPITRSHPSTPDRIPSSPESAAYSGGAHTPIPRSTCNTPAQFYAQLVPVRGSGGLAPSADGGSPRSRGSDGDVSSGGIGYGNGRKRPIRGRFVEVDHM
ncbi:uncharacterized protein EI97DRAFT_437964 [Westerdykella ornata]|uniref:Galactose oxidase n=1 Tax=Westerdykella ornata TaxID=318751 RepID=A0A6A6J429_WESOR|nr:uncharacterized protein EI97DRAFT_437964 [Westerdykella ornata]KAF2271331.1 hypothetical protein EI97DRAFT_437964 [Westerdykella ornata]